MKDKLETYKKRNIILATGGSGGHIIPAKTIAHELIKQGYKPIIVAGENYERYIDDNINYKIIRTGKSLRKIKDIFNFVAGTCQTLIYFLLKRPILVIGFGSYSSAPSMIAAVLLRKKIIIQEQNPVMGRVNHFFSRFASVIMTAYCEMYNVRYKDMNKISYVGNPIRGSIQKLYNLKYQYPNSDDFNILITGGSGGSNFFSNKLIYSFKHLDLKIRNKLKITQQCRKEDVEFVKDFYQEMGIKNEINTFFIDMADKLKSAHLVICRSGAMTANECTIAGKPSIMFPYPHAAYNEQFIIAKELERGKCAKVIEEKEFNNLDFAKILEELIQNQNILTEMSDNARKLAKQDANKNIIQLIERNITTSIQDKIV